MTLFTLMGLMKSLSALGALIPNLSSSMATCVALTSALLVAACVPPAEPETEVQEPEPEKEGAIPWAPGEAPGSAEATTREAPPEPKAEENAPVYYEEDGVKQASSGPSCTGKAPPALRASVDVRAGETKSCSEKIPSAQVGAQGDMKVSVRVARTGQVESVEILSDTLNISEVATCVKETLEKPFTDARPRGGCTVFLLPLHFESAEVEAVDEPDPAGE